MKYLPPNTLAYVAGSPHFHKHDMSTLPLSAFADSTGVYLANTAEVSPNEDAVIFYTLNHLYSLVAAKHTPNQPLPEWANTIAQTYLGVVSRQGLRMLHYLLCITTKEMRHMRVSQGSQVFWDIIKKEYSLAFKIFLQDICGPSENEAVNRFTSQPPNITVGQYVSGLRWAFDNGPFSGGFGGPMWGQVARAAEDFITGKGTLERVVDTGFTLRHNNNPIFNKGIIYGHQDEGKLDCILDVQRSGQMPDLMLDNGKHGVVKPALAVDMVKLLLEALPGAFKGYVDWVEVKKSFSLAPDAKHGYPLSELIKAQKAVHAPKVPKVKKVGEVTNEVVGTWTVSPGQTVEVFKRVKA